MKMIGWKNGKQKILITDNPKKLEEWAEEADSYEYYRG